MSDDKPEESNISSNTYDKIIIVLALLLIIHFIIYRKEIFCPDCIQPKIIILKESDFKNNGTYNMDRRGGHQTEHFTPEIEALFRKQEEEYRKRNDAMVNMSERSMVEQYQYDDIYNFMNTQQGKYIFSGYTKDELDEIIDLIHVELNNN